MIFIGSRILPLAKFVKRADALVVLRRKGLRNIEKELKILAEKKIGTLYRQKKFLRILTRYYFKSFLKIYSPEWSKHGGIA